MKQIDVDSDIREPNGEYRKYTVFADDVDNYEIFECTGEYPYKRSRIPDHYIPKVDMALIKEKVKERFFMDEASDTWDHANIEFPLVMNAYHK